MTDPWWRARVSSETYEVIANMQYLDNVLGVRSSMDLLWHRMCLVIQLDKAKHVHRQLRERFSTIHRGRKAASTNEVARPVSFHITVIQ